MVTKLTIQGLVQGVGFRPFIYLLAKEMGLKGTVANYNNGVVIHITCTDGDQINLFIARIREQHPPVADIYSINKEYSAIQDSFYDFSILASDDISDEVTQVAPDIAICPACLHDRTEHHHRISYPFINCTHCGPRFSIVSGLPYDRANTTMSDFPMCSDCAKEYNNIADRRFHAQPVACNHCGPQYYATYKGVEYKDYKELLDLSVRLLNEGKVIAAKGVGGYHLVCDATNEKAVNHLREIKHRDTKPFAVMFRDVENLREYTLLNETEKENITLWRRPIVLLKQYRPLAQSVNPGMKTLGCMLPYMAIHYDWLAKLNISALVMTSGNLSELPIVISPDEADSQFGDKVELILHHNRAIHNRVDDSVVQVCNSRACIIRRSRGYAPEPFFANIETEGILAFGSEKVNTFALGRDRIIIQSQYIGDLKNWETFNFYKESLSRFQHLFRFHPKQLVCDLHPDYMSSREAADMALSGGLPLIRVQHHHAHAAACMLEHGLDEPVLAVVWDGTGLGDDGNIWGGEFLLCDRSDYTRLSHLEYVPMPGGDKASDEPWRMAVSYLYHYGLPIPQPFKDRVGVQKVDALISIIRKQVNTPLTSGAGRLFDAFASLLGICDIATRQAEAPVLLEQVADENYKDLYKIDVYSEPVSMKSVLIGIMEDMAAQLAIGKISAKIHNSLVYFILEKSKVLLEGTGTTKTVISGGCFQNKRLTEHLQLLFSQEGLSLYVPSRIPCNDSGVAVGQLTIASARNKY